ncbi:hypothetical protein SLUN_01215 [Streptomyces lunaelactis]|uniref:Uncharacterized protein n=1 Tax=Streptomyces lunaelactis TaxID=1535768 RepID=A0A2R4SW27_9ACTN|nr:hypothetical protein [Streptomyces lunaelactis]AVZ71075.1 hypothetical protein SLUN_01215 [Streptomyces lunaelactis]NUK22657.1 hypothetical protein [Streptomyces lunaelactis]NUK88149.1 hypothetical protein [Streptomyces lunaelactis]
MPERIWHPISKMEFFVEHTRRWLVDVRENAEALEEARTKPHVLADTDVARIKRVYTEQAGDLTLFEEQAEAWGQLPDLSPSRRQKLTALNEQMAELRELNKKVLELADELAKGTIDTVMAASDEELGLAALARPEAGRVEGPAPRAPYH